MKTIQNKLNQTLLNLDSATKILTKITRSDQTFLEFANELDSVVEAVQKAARANISAIFLLKEKTKKNNQNNW